VNKLVPLLIAGAPARNVNMSSRGHHISDVDLDDPGFERTTYDPWQAYGRAKTANVLFAVALDKRLRDRGVRACAVHPGGIRTELGRHLTPEAMAALTARRPASSFNFKSIPQGAATSIWSAIVADADAVGGRYCEDCHVAEPIGDEPADAGVRRYAVDPARAEALWAKSEELVGERFPLALPLGRT
jgi:NAD(P)-dependent dehydrogenase (short-subunit alcohol dehydrogenase family)